MKKPLSVWLRRPWKQDVPFWISLAAGAVMISTYALSVSYFTQLGCGIAGALIGATLCAIVTGSLPLFLTSYSGGVVWKLGLRKVSSGSLWRPAFCGFLWIFLFTELVTLLWKHLLLALHCPFEEQQPLLIFITDTTFANKCLLFLTVCVFVPVMEELFFRRYLNALLRKAGGVVTLLAGAAIFAAAHNFLLGIPALFFMGVVFQLLYSKSRNFAVPVLCHALVNAAAFAGALLTR